jgi:hypothetical protein
VRYLLIRAKHLFEGRGMAGTGPTRGRARASLVRYRLAYMPTGTVMESRTIGHYRTLSEAKAAAQRDHDQNRDQGR